MFNLLFKKNKKESSPVQEEKRTWRFWRRHLVKSQETMAEEARVATTQLEEVYENQLKETTSLALQEFGKFLARLEKESQSAQEKKMFEFDKAIDGALASFTSQLVEKVTLEEEKVRAEVESYKKAAVASLQERLSRVVEKATKIVIGKSLSTSDQADLVIEALEQAKKEEFI